jgi:TonB-dependent starch-binding outer membrane protein SusC
MKKNGFCDWKCKHSGPPRILIIMKFSMLLLFIPVLSVLAGKSYSQSTELSLNMENAPLKEVLSSIEDQSEFYFMYSEKVVNVERRVSIVCQDRKVEPVLNELLEGTNIQFRIKDRIIILTTPEILNESVGMFSQPLLITGTVTDKDGQALLGLTVRIKGTTKGVISSEDGTYAIEVSGEEDILVFSYVGMQPQEIVVGTRTVIDVIMLEETTTLDELVVVGYQTKRKRDITGSIANISGAKLAESRTESFTQALQGRAAGVYVKSNSGQPGGGVSVRIRGIGGLNNSEPLYIIDGVQVAGSSGSDNSNPLASLNPSDIESLEVLKDASSAAIYGARGANGVVIITTKRGKMGEPGLTYRGSFGVQNITNVNDFGVLNAREYAERVNAAAIADGGYAIFGGPNEWVYPHDLFPDPSELGEGTDWLDVIFAENTPVQEHQLSYKGGNEKHNYYVSLNYLDQDGLVDRTYYKRYSFRVNSDTRVNKFIKMGNSLAFSHSSSNYYWSTRTGNGGLLVDALTYSPTIPTHNPDGSWAGPPHDFYPPQRTPYARVNSNDNDRRISSLLGNVYAELAILKSLSFRSSFSADLSLNTNNSWGHTWEEGILSDQTTGVYNTTQRSGTWIWSNVLNFNKDIDRHHISAILGTECSESSTRAMAASARYNDNGIRIVSPTSSNTFSVDEWMSSWSLLSYFGNLAYNFANKYYIEGNIRRDGSSRFGANSRWGLFPSFSGAWRISEESFFPVPQIDDLKIRASYGEVGNNNIGDFAYIARLTSVLYAFGDNNGSFTNGLAIDDVANPDLKWETSKQTNFGLDLAMFGSKLSFTADYFQTEVSDMLLGIAIPAVTGINSSQGQITLATVISNAGSLLNKGFEFELGFRNSLGSFSYGFSANLTTFDNEVTDIGGNEEIWGMTIDGQNVSRTVVGGSLGEYYGYEVEGIFQNQDEIDAADALDGDPSTPYQSHQTAPGDFRYKDVTGDGVVADDDRTVIGSPVPDFTYGLNVNLAYKGFDLSMLLTGTQGNDIFNASRINLEASGLTNFNKSRAVLESWDGEGSSNTVARATGNDPNQNKRISSIYVEDGSYLRLREVRLGYNLPLQVIQKLYMSSAVVYISAQNLLTLTGYSGFDPEVGNLSGNNLNSSIDNDVYPQVKSISAGIQISF